MAKGMVPDGGYILSESMRKTLSGLVSGQLSEAETRASAFNLCRILYARYGEKAVVLMDP